MRNPEVTKETIFKKSGILFNTQGYESTSISNITDATGLQKALFISISSKDELEIERLRIRPGLSLQNFGRGLTRKIQRQ